MTGCGSSPKVWYFPVFTTPRTARPLWVLSSGSPRRCPIGSRPGVEEASHAQSGPNEQHQTNRDLCGQEPTPQSRPAETRERRFILQRRQKIKLRAPQRRSQTEHEARRESEQKREREHAPVNR